VLSCRDRVLIFGTPAEDVLPRGDDLEAILMGAVDYLEKLLAPVDWLRFIEDISDAFHHGTLTLASRKLLGDISRRSYCVSN